MRIFKTLEDAGSLSVMQYLWDEWAREEARTGNKMLLP